MEQQHPDGTVEAGDLHARLLVGADGVQSTVGRDFGLPRPREFLGGFEAEIGGLRLPDTKTIPLFTDQEMAPGFFSWIIPLNATTGRGGLCMRMRRTSARSKFDAFLAHPQVAPYVDDPRILKPIVGTVPLGMPSRFTTDRVLLVGDAAAMPKPTSGGGIWTGLAASVHAAAAADRALAAGDTSDRVLATYARAFWRSKVGREVRIGWRIRRAFTALSNQEINEALRLMASRRALGVIDSFGDIDHPSHLLAPMLLAQPRLLKFAPKAIRHAFAS
jgi:flavin-dependent dehydrogenase